jgi:3'-phosphoadenosine 5'-phosphosulfate sulfotransferase (PAPS reductase)/FAD synthetase
MLTSSASRGQLPLWFDLPASPNPAPDLASYDQILVAFSGGADSLACVLMLREAGIPAERIHLHHHLVDGRESDMMDWPCTEGYCNAVARELGMDISYSWRVGGMEREMLRDGSPTAPVAIPSADGWIEIGGKGDAGTRRMFPQVSQSLTTRWCSSYLKIACMDAWLRNDPKFRSTRTLVITGERAQESSARAKYAMFEPHRADRRDGRSARHVDHWRPVHGLLKEEVWALIERWKLLAHPAYYCGFGRCSCRACIFGSKNQWATIRVMAPAQFERIALYEREFGVTIQRTESVMQQADLGTPYAIDPFWMEVANSREFTIPVKCDPWIRPSGASGEACGPS